MKLCILFAYGHISLRGYTYLSIAALLMSLTPYAAATDLSCNPLQLSSIAAEATLDAKGRSTLSDANAVYYFELHKKILN